jgi:hypothetical protein
MKYVLSAFFLVAVGFLGKAQPCTLLTKTFAVADTMGVKEGELYRFRFSKPQLDQLAGIPGLEKPVAAIGKLQKTLDQDNSSFREGVFWQLDEKLAEKFLVELQGFCPETEFGVYWKELMYYRRYYKTDKK